MVAVQQDPETHGQQRQARHQGHHVVDVEGKLEAGQAAASLLSILHHSHTEGLKYTVPTSEKHIIPALKNKLSPLSNTRLFIGNHHNILFALFSLFLINFTL